MKILMIMELPPFHVHVKKKNETKRRKLRVELKDQDFHDFRKFFVFYCQDLLMSMPNPHFQNNYITSSPVVKYKQAT